MSEWSNFNNIFTYITCRYRKISGMDVVDFWCSFLDYREWVAVLHVQASLFTVIVNLLQWLQSSVMYCTNVLLNPRKPDCIEYSSGKNFKTVSQVRGKKRVCRHKGWHRHLHNSGVKRMSAKNVCKRVLVRCRFLSECCLLSYAQFTVSLYCIRSLCMDFYLGLCPNTKFKFVDRQEDKSGWNIVCKNNAELTKL